MNSGPGNIGGIFVHQKHHSSHLPKLSGWWGQNPLTKFDMANNFDEIPGANGFRLSNPSVLCVTSLLSSLLIFEETSMEALCTRSKLLTAYLESLIKSRAPSVKIITPSNPHERGAQLSLILPGGVDSVATYLKENGIVFDYRKPDVIRVAPAPLYNTFEDVWVFVDLLSKALDRKN